MKKLAFTISVVALVISISSCNKKGPEEVVKKYYAHFYKGEYDKIQDIVLEEHRSFYELMNQVIPAEEKEKVSKVPVNVTDVKCQITDDTVAICSCTITIDGQESRNEEIKLKRVENIWLIDQGKENSMPDLEEVSEIEEEEIIITEEENSDTL